jgi:hypothetical protein
LLRFDFVDVGVSTAAGALRLLLAAPTADVLADAGAKNKNQVLIEKSTILKYSKITHCL